LLIFDRQGLNTGSQEKFGHTVFFGVFDPHINVDHIFEWFPRVLPRVPRPFDFDFRFAFSGPELSNFFHRVLLFGVDFMQSFGADGPRPLGDWAFGEKKKVLFQS
jgi:hypothetical protein